MNLLKATKLNMSQVFLDDGTVLPVTWVLLENIDGISEGSVVSITGVSKGKGFSGVIKRHGFRRGPKTHGASDRERAPGSIGAESYSKVYKGKKMAGKHGNKTVTIKDVKVLQILDKKAALSGPIPGAFGGKVNIILKSE